MVTEMNKKSKGLGATTTQALKDRFITAVKSRCEGLGIDLIYNLELMGHERDVDMIMFHLTITPISITGDPTLTEIATLCEALERYTHNEDPAFVHAGRNWHLGDGDDTLATFMRHGKFCIWLRGWNSDEV